MEGKGRKAVLVHLYEDGVEVEKLNYWEAEEELKDIARYLHELLFNHEDEHYILHQYTLSIKRIAKAPKEVVKKAGIDPHNAKIYKRVIKEGQYKVITYYFIF